MKKGRPNQDRPSFAFLHCLLSTVYCLLFTVYSLPPYFTRSPMRFQRTAVSQGKGRSVSPS